MSRVLQKRFSLQFISRDVCFDCLRCFRRRQLFSSGTSSFSIGQAKRSSQSSCYQLNTNIALILQQPKSALLGPIRLYSDQPSVKPPLDRQTERVKSGIVDKAKDLKENILTVPNLLCVSRIIAAPILGCLVIFDYYAFACILFCAAGITDLLDGLIARIYPSQQSVLGSVLDPIADKCLVGTLFVALTYTGLIPLTLTCMIVARDVCLLTAGFYIRFISLPKPKTLVRYFNPTIASAKMCPTSISKVNTAIQLLLVTASLGAPVFNYIDAPAIQVLWYITGISTVISGFSYIFTKNTFQILRKDTETEKYWCYHEW